jgi:hypothetical protein
MALPWFGSSKAGDVAELIARKKYAKAIEVLREQLRIESRDAHVRKQLADLLILAGRAREAVPVMIELADEFAAQGFAAKAIALLKKIEKIDPGRLDVDVKLAQVMSGERARTKQAWTPGSRVDNAGYEPAGVSFGEEHFAAPTADPYSDERRIAAAKAASWTPDTRQEDVEPAAEMAAFMARPAPSEEESIEVTPEPSADDDEESIEVSPEVFRGAMLDVIQNALRQPPAPEPEPEGGAVPPPGEQGALGIVASPLFSGFTKDELVAVMRGLRLLTFEPGDIILTQGDPGRSVFVLATGVVKAFVKEASGRRQVMVRTMEEGEFFGEISILSGKPRTATVTAATTCELLELDRESLDRITQTFPHVLEVLQEFYIQRASSQEEAMARAVRSPGRSAVPEDAEQG